MKICIFGCGYVGRAVAQYFFARKHTVTTTTRHVEKIASLSSFSQETLLLQGDVQALLEKMLPSQDVLILTMAPDASSSYEETYLHTARLIFSLGSKNTPFPSIIYTSSTSVYREKDGNPVMEDSPLEVKNPFAKILIETEHTLLSLMQMGRKVCIFRLSEIYGPERSIVDRLKKMKGKKFSGDGNKYANMVHLDDIVRAIDFACKRKLLGVYNLSDDDHPIKKIWYDQICKEHSMEKIVWDPMLPSSHGGNKKVSNQKIKEAGYVFVRPHRVIELAQQD